MTDRELADALEAVHQQLADADHLDPTDVGNLRDTMTEIQCLIGFHKPVLRR